MTPAQAQNGEYLSQDEVDALLKGVALEEDAPAAAAPASPAQTFSIATQERIVRERLPALALVNDRFVRSLRHALTAFLRRAPEVTLADARTTRYAEFVAALPAPASFNLLQLKPTGGAALLVFEPALVSLVVDQLFGGDGRFGVRAAQREFTATEERLNGRLLELLLAEYRNAWSRVHPFDFALVRTEEQPSFVSLCAPQDVVVVCSFNVQLGAVQGLFHVCFPDTSLDPLRPAAEEAAAPPPAPVDARWTQSLMGHVRDAEVELVATLASFELPLRELMGLQPGSLLRLEIANHVVAEIHGVPLLHCQYGTLNGRYALRVQRVLSRENAGADHA